MPTYIASVYVKGTGGAEDSRILVRALATSPDAFRVRILEGLLAQVPQHLVSFGPIGESRRPLSADTVDVTGTVPVERI